MTDTTVLVLLGCRLLGLWGLLNAAQWWAARKQWRGGTALGWDLQGLRTAWPWRAALLRRTFTNTGLPAIILLHGSAALALVLAPLSPLLLLALLALVGTSMLLVVRSVADGADKMALVVGWGLLAQVAGLLATSEWLVFAGTLWIGGQLTLCYATAGFAKLALASWRDGSAVRSALASHTHGHRCAAPLLTRPGVALGVAWMVMVLEVLFPLALMAPPPITAAMLAAMLALHGAIAVVMGLNTYLWAFIAAYPAVLLLAQHIGSAAAWI